MLRAFLDDLHSFSPSVGPWQHAADPGNLDGAFDDCSRAECKDGRTTSQICGFRRTNERSYDARVDEHRLTEVDNHVVVTVEGSVNLFANSRRIREVEVAFK